MANKTWNKSKALLICGWCNVCQKELLRNEGGWIVNAVKKHFCHDGKDGSCFDKYCEDQKNIAEDASYEGS